MYNGFFSKTFWREFNIADFGKKKFLLEKLKIYFETEKRDLKKEKMGDLKLPPFFGFGNDSFVDSTTNSKDHIVAKYVIIT